jgi:hypothetical protein
MVHDGKPAASYWDTFYYTDKELEHMVGTKRFTNNNKKPRVVLVHGFNVRDKGKRSIDTLAPHLERLGWQVDKDEADYGWIGLLGVRLFKRKIVKRLVKALWDADLIITHSNGANFATAALNKMHSWDEYFVAHISPALNTTTPCPNSVFSMLVLHTKNDWAVRLASLLPFHPWGSMGAYGYLGKRDGRVTSEDYTGIVEGHSDWFSDPVGFAERINEFYKTEKQSF